MADFIFGYFMGSVFKSLVVGVSSINASGAVKDALFMVDKLGF